MQFFFKVMSLTCFISFVFVPQFIMSHQTLSFPLPICFIMCHYKFNFHPVSHAKHAFPTDSPSHVNKPHTTYQFPLLALSFCVNVMPQPYIFPNPLDHAHVGPFSPFHSTTPLVVHDQTPKPTFISSTCLQLPPKVSCPTYWR